MTRGILKKIKFHSFFIFVLGKCTYSHDMAQSAGAVEYTDDFSAEGQDPHHERPTCNTKQFDCKVPIIMKL